MKKEWIINKLEEMDECSLAAEVAAMKNAFIDLDIDANVDVGKWDEEYGKKGSDEAKLTYLTCLASGLEQDPRAMEEVGSMYNLGAMDLMSFRDVLGAGREGGLKSQRYVWIVDKLVKMGEFRFAAQVAAMDKRVGTDDVWDEDWASYIGDQTTEGWIIHLAGLMCGSGRMCGMDPELGPEAGVIDFDDNIDVLSIMDRVDEIALNKEGTPDQTGRVPSWLPRGEERYNLVGETNERVKEEIKRGIWETAKQVGRGDITKQGYCLGRLVGYYDTRFMIDEITRTELLRVLEEEMGNAVLRAKGEKNPVKRYYYWGKVEALGGMYFRLSGRIPLLYNED